MMIQTLKFVFNNIFEHHFCDSVIVYYRSVKMCEDEKKNGLSCDWSISFSRYTISNYSFYTGE